MTRAKKVLEKGTPVHWEAVVLSSWGRGTSAARVAVGIEINSNADRMKHTCAGNQRFSIRFLLLKDRMIMPSIRSILYIVQYLW